MPVKLFIILSCVAMMFLAPTQAAAEAWFFKPNGNEPPTTDSEYIKLLDKYDGAWIGDTSKKTIYLTFDNGYEEGYTKEILNVLDKKNVPAAFFITGQYIKDQPKIVKRMVKEGHIVGNHSWGHPDLSKISDKKYKEEIKRLDMAFHELTGKHMKYLRPPRGTFSKRALELGYKMGYHNIFWSFAYVDWLTDQQKGKKHAYKSIMKRVHPGAIMLLHTVSKDNAKALPKVIDDLRDKGYRCKSLDYLMGQKKTPEFIF